MTALTKWRKFFTDMRPRMSKRQTQVTIDPPDGGMVRIQRRKIKPGHERIVVDVFAARSRA